MLDILKSVLRSKRLVFLLLVILASCKKDDRQEKPSLCITEAMPKGLRLLGMDILNAAEGGSFDENVALAESCGASFTSLHLNWNQINPNNAVFVDPDQVLVSINHHCQLNGWKLNMMIRSIDIPGKNLPTDLAEHRFNSPEVIARMEATIDFVLDRVAPVHLTSLLIGNEIDAYDTSQEPASFWSDYGEFMAACKHHLDRKYPQVKLGFAITLLGCVEGPHASSGIFQGLAELVDIVVVTYYPQKGFIVMDPSVAESHFDAITAKFPNTTLFMDEVGYQTSAVCQSSEDLQAQFVCEVFKAWDKHQEQIPMLSFVRLNDISRDDAVSMAGDYHSNDELMIEYLQTVGLRTYDGKGLEKEAFGVLREQALLRGF